MQAGRVVGVGMSERHNDQIVSIAAAPGPLSISEETKLYVLPAWPSSMSDIAAASAMSRTSTTAIPRLLDLCETAIHEHFCSCDVATIIGCEKYDSLRDLNRCTDPAEGDTV